MRHCFRRPLAAILSASLALLAACGGSGSSDSGAESCDLDAQKTELRGYMADWYLWAGLSPDPEPGGYATVAGYFNALKFTGNATLPADRWSYVEATAAHEEFFGAGRTMGYGVSVNGVEAVLPLQVRFVDPGSPADLAGLQRGDTIVSANGRAAADLVAAKDFSALSAAAQGQSLALAVEHGGVARSLDLAAATYDLVPVTAPQVFTLAGGKKAGYLVMKEFVTQAEAPLAAAVADFRAQGATELILDLRYNGGGLVSTSAQLASLVTGASQPGKPFVQLKFNAAHPEADTTVPLVATPGAAFQRVVVLTGPRTCSASELVVNGLKPYVEVVTVGGTTCGKPVGFRAHATCGNTYSAVNFESVNAAGQGGYYAGIAPTCPASDDLGHALGDAREGMTAMALGYLENNGQCPATFATAQRAHALSAAPPSVPRMVEPGERRGMWLD
jgi:hypothetical protein